MRDSSISFLIFAVDRPAIKFILAGVLLKSVDGGLLDRDWRIGRRGDW